jgi:hypothetical protein
LNLCREKSLEFSKLVQLAAMRTLHVCTRPESNWDQRLRKPLLYPLSYGCSCGEGGIRTHGEENPHSGFQDRRTSPLCDLTTSK